MIEVSEAWVRAFNQPLVPETFVEISLDVRLGNGFSGVVGGNCRAPFAGTELQVMLNRTLEFLQEYLYPYAMLEHNAWTLDGTKNIVSDLDEYTAKGYVSEKDEFGFAEITFNNSVSEEAVGFHLIWDYEHETFPINFTFSVFSDDTLLDSVYVENNNTLDTFIELTVSNFNRIVITFENWSKPDCRVRLMGLTLGTKLVFDKSQILSYSHEQTGDLGCSELSMNKIEFSLDNSDGRWDLLNREGLSKRLSETQKLEVRYGVDISGTTEWINAGLFYLSEWVVPSDGLEARFVATDLLQFLHNSNTHIHRDSVKMSFVVDSPDERVYGYPTPALDLYGDEPSTYFLSDGTDTITVYDVVATYENDRIENPEDYRALAYKTGYPRWISADKLAPATDLSVYAKIGKALLPDGFPWVTYKLGDITKEVNLPMFIERTSQIEFIQMCANLCGCSVWQDTEGIIHVDIPSTQKTDYVIPLDWSYTHPEVELSKVLQNVDVIGHYEYCDETSIVREVINSTEKGETITVDNPYALATNDLTPTVTPYVKMWEGRTQVSGTFRADPRLELFDIIEIESKYGWITPVVITSIKYTYNGSFVGSYTGRKTYTE